MLKFDRKAFRSGIQIVREPAMVSETRSRQVVDGQGRGIVDEQGNPTMEAYEVSVEGMISYTFKVSDKGSNFAFIDEAYVLAKYPALFTQVVDPA